MRIADLRELLAGASLALQQCVYFIGPGQGHALRFSADVGSVPCASCAHRAGTAVSPSVQALDGREEETLCRGGFPVVSVSLAICGESVGTLAAGPVCASSQGYLDALRSMLRACASLAAEEQLFPERLGTFDELSRYICEHIDAPLSARRLQSVFFLSADTLSRLTLREAGLPLQGFIRAKRMEAARTLLLATSLSVQEVAGRCGVSDFNYFSRIFKKHYGCTPTEMRRSNGAAARERP